MATRPDKPKAKQLYSHPKQIPVKKASEKHESDAKAEPKKNKSDITALGARNKDEMKRTEFKEKSESRGTFRGKVEEKRTRGYPESFVNEQETKAKHKSIEGQKKHSSKDEKAAGRHKSDKEIGVERGYQLTETRRQFVASGSETIQKRIPSAKSPPSLIPGVSLPRRKKQSPPPNTLKVMIMNASGKDDTVEAPADRRRNVIQTVIVKHSPDILLFQEFRWVGITGKIWEPYPIPSYYTYKGHTEASMIYDENSISVKDLPATEIDSLLGSLQNNASNRLKMRFPLDFTPVPRMCLTKVTSKKSQSVNFIVISWHGRSNESGRGGSMKEEKKIEYFKYLMEFLRKLKEKVKLPILIAGDFNVNIHSIETLVQPPFKLCMYDASPRRTMSGILDFFIITEELGARDMKWIDIERDTKVVHAADILDHDPVSALFHFSTLPKGKSDTLVSPNRKANSASV